MITADGREVHCLDLAGAGVEESSTGAVLDDTARRRRERRIRELQEELEEAEHDHDLARACKSQVELDALIDHLTGRGEGQQARTAGGTVERARSAVTLHPGRHPPAGEGEPQPGPPPPSRHQHRDVLQLPARAPHHLAHRLSATVGPPSPSPDLGFGGGSDAAGRVVEAGVGPEEHEAAGADRPVAVLRHDDLGRSPIGESSL